MTIDTQFLSRCIQALETALAQLNKNEEGTETVAEYIKIIKKKAFSFKLLPSQKIKILTTIRLLRCLIFIGRCIFLLKCFLQRSRIEYDIYRSAIIKEFEIILEQSGKLLKKRLRPYFHSNKSVDKLTFKGLFRYAGNHGLLEREEVERWLQYRDNRNATAHNYGVGLTQQTLPLMPQFIKDVKRMIEILNSNHDTEN